MSTIKDVARVAGVSTSTVSSFLNRTKYVSPGLESKILDAMAILNYRRTHPIARSLRSRQTGHIGVVLDRLTSEQTIRSLKAISDALNERGFTLMLRDAKGNAKMEAQYIQDLVSQQVDGLILAPVGPASRATLRGLNPDLPLVLLGDGLHDWLAHRPCGVAVSYAVQEGGRQSVDYFLAHQHRRIGLITNEFTGQVFLQGYEQALVSAGVDVTPELIRSAPATYSGGHSSLRSLMELVDPPTAVFVTEPDLLAGVLNSLFELRIRCPDQLSLIAFGHIDWADAIQPPLTTLQGDCELLGRVAAQQLLAQLESGCGGQGAKEGIAERAMYISARLVERGSVALCRETAKR